MKTPTTTQQLSKPPNLSPLLKSAPRSEDTHHQARVDYLVYSQQSDRSHDFNNSGLSDHRRTSMPNITTHHQDNGQILSSIYQSPPLSRTTSPKRMSPLELESLSLAQLSSLAPVSSSMLHAISYSNDKQSTLEIEKY